MSNGHSVSCSTKWIEWIRWIHNSLMICLPGHGSYISEYGLMCYDMLLDVEASGQMTRLKYSNHTGCMTFKWSAFTFISTKKRDSSSPTLLCITRRFLPYTPPPPPQKKKKKNDKSTEIQIGYSELGKVSSSANQQDGLVNQQDDLAS